MQKHSLDFNTLQYLYLSTNKKIIKLDNYVLNPKKISKAYYASNYSNYNISGIRLFIYNGNFLEFFKNRSVNFYSLITYYSVFFRNALISLKKVNKKLRGLIVCLLKGCYIILKYFARKYDQYYTSIFMPDVFTNSEQFKLTEYYEYGNHFRFMMYSEPKFCWFFHTYSIKDDLIFYHVFKSRLLMFSFTNDDSVIDSSDFFFPYNVCDYKTLYGGVMLMCIFFYDLFSCSFNRVVPAKLKKSFR